MRAAFDRHVGFDTHVWLDPLNAIAMVTNIATTLAAFDPAQAQAYRDGTPMPTDRARKK